MITNKSAERECAWQLEALELHHDYFHGHTVLWFCQTRSALSVAAWLLRH